MENTKLKFSSMNRLIMESKNSKKILKLLLGVNKIKYNISTIENKIRLLGNWLIVKRDSYGIWINSFYIFW